MHTVRVKKFHRRGNCPLNTKAALKRTSHRQEWKRSRLKTALKSILPRWKIKQGNTNTQLCEIPKNIWVSTTKPPQQIQGEKMTNRNMPHEQVWYVRRGKLQTTELVRGKLFIFSVKAVKTQTMVWQRRRWRNSREVRENVRIANFAARKRWLINCVDETSTVLLVQTYRSSPANEIVEFYDVALQKQR